MESEEFSTPLPQEGLEGGSGCPLGQEHPVRSGHVPKEGVTGGRNR